MDFLEHDPFWTMSLDEELRYIDLHWTAATRSMTPDDFKRALQAFADHAERQSAKGLLVNVTEFQFAMTDELNDWRVAEILPRYQSAGVRRFAYVLPQGAPTREPAQYDGEPFVTGYFHTDAEASAWLAGG